MRWRCTQRRWSLSVQWWTENQTMCWSVISALSGTTALYTAEDLNYNNSNCRANREMNDENARPAIGSQTIDLSGYDTVFIGYPIWWGTMPRIINTFLDTYDLSGKTVMPFCTSGGSGVSRSVSDIKKAESKADVRDGLRASGANDRNLEKWLSDNNIK